MKTMIVALGAALISLGACASGGLAPPEPPQPVEEAVPPPAPRAAETPQPFEPLLRLGAPVVEAPPAPDPNAPPDVAAAPARAEQTASGLRWKLLHAGTGTEHARAQDTVRIHYTGWMTSGVKFDSSVDAGQPAEYVVGNVMKGWTEALQMMVVGEKRRFWIPGSLAFGDQPRKMGRPYGTLVYDLELLHVTRAPEPPRVPDDLRAPPSDARRTRSGLVYRVLEKGTGTEHPGPHSGVEVHYSGWTRDGSLFDSSVVRGQTASFTLDRVIRGWSEGLQLMEVGERARFWIPAKLAYGDSPAAGMPAGPLVFDVELVDIAVPRPEP